MKLHMPSDSWKNIKDNLGKNGAQMLPFAEQYPQNIEALEGTARRLQVPQNQKSGTANCPSEQGTSGSQNL